MTGDRYSDRTFYRALHRAADLVYFRITVSETDLHIGALRPLHEEALCACAAARAEIEEEIAARPAFLTSLVPLAPRGDETPLVLSMLNAAACASVGPMAAVAGAVGGVVGRALAERSAEVIVENGGDLYLQGMKERVVAVFAGTNPLSGKLGVKIKPEDGLGVCTSSGTFGHSLSFGRADAALVIARDPALADAAATKLGNLIRLETDIENALNEVFCVKGVVGALAIAGNQLGVKGEIELAAL